MDDFLSGTQVQEYRENGFLFPIDLFDASGVQQILDEIDQARCDCVARNMPDGIDLYLRNNAHLMMPFVSDVASNPRLLDKIESILGPDLILWSAEFFVKKAATEKIVTWHQDLTYWGLGETDEEVTAWIALSDVTQESGCMRFVPGSHHQQILPHRDTFDECNLLSRGQEVDVDVDESTAVDVILKPGQLSLHHGRIFHASGPNRSANDRIGMVFRFLTPRVRQQIGKRDYAMLMRGKDETGNWIHLEKPRSNFAPVDFEQYKTIKAEQYETYAQGIDSGAKLNAAF
ncbi:MAG: phytanoyl-CoA dioxygenase family protein [Pseudomonadota bacterium]